MTTKILCPIDFSPGSKHAMQVAVRMASDVGAELVLAHSWYLPPSVFTGDVPFPADMIQKMIDDEEQGLAAITREAIGLGAKQAEPLFLTGSPWVRIVETLERDAAFDLVVLGTHGRTGLRRFLLGSVAENVVRHAPCSVLVTRGDATKFTRILCPIDFSDGSREAVDAAAELARRTAAPITLVHVVEVPLTYSEPPIGDLVGDLEKRSARVLEQWATELRAKVPTTVTVTTRARLGSPGAQTLEVLDADPTVDLVVVGSHGRTGIRRVLLGSVAEKIVRHATCSVMVARVRH